MEFLEGRYTRIRLGTFCVFFCAAAELHPFTPPQEKTPLSTLYDKLVVEWGTTLRVAVPAFLYVVQNNVLFIAATELDAPVFQVGKL